MSSTEGLSKGQFQAELASFRQQVKNINKGSGERTHDVKKQSGSHRFARML
jgi:hypothetical protein